VLTIISRQRTCTLCHILERVWQSGGVEPTEPTPEEYEATIAQLRAELERLREEIRLLRHDRHQVPPHY